MLRAGSLREVVIVKVVTGVRVIVARLNPKHHAANTTTKHQENRVKAVGSTEVTG